MDFNPEELSADAISWFSDAMEQCGGTKAVIGISGGKDSTVVAALAVKALGSDNVIGILLPNGDQGDINDSYKVCNLLGVKNHTINIGNMYKELTSEISNKFGYLADVTRINTPPRLRMTTLYAVAGSIKGARVINTSNRSEAYVGYCTKWGDMCGDIYPLINLTVAEVINLGRGLGLPEDLLIKPPADGLSGKTDEDNLGFSYSTVDKILKHHVDSGYFDSIVDESKVMERHKNSRHKFCKIEFNPYSVKG